MITYADYYAAYPTPAIVQLCNPSRSRFSEPHLGAGRVHLVDDGIRPYRTTAVSIDDYVAALSKTAWRDSAYLAEALEIDREAVKRRMLNGPMVKLTNRKKMSGKWVWKLK